MYIHCTCFHRADYLHVLELDSSYLPARVNLAFFLQAEGRFKQAWDELSCVLQEDSGFAPALEAKGIISLQMGNTFGALFNSALKVSCSIALQRDAFVGVFSPSPKIDFFPSP